MQRNIIYIADNQGRLINKGVVFSMVVNNNGDIVIKAKEQLKYKHKDDRRKALA